jgi:hypothetical protein
MSAKLRIKHMQIIEDKTESSERYLKSPMPGAYGQGPHGTTLNRNNAYPYLAQISCHRLRHSALHLAREWDQVAVHELFPCICRILGEHQAVLENGRS